MKNHVVASLTLVGLLMSCAEPEPERTRKELRQDPSDVMADFYSNPGPEETLMDPLIVAGPSIYPTVIAAIKDKKMPLRRYAISFLGNEEVTDAIPRLINIVEDESELDYFRGDALAALYKIELRQAKELASSYVDRDDTLGRYATAVLNDATYLNERRSLSKARKRWHD